MAGSKVRTPVFRASYAYVVEPTKNDDGAEVYSIAMIFEPDDDLKPMLRIAKAAAQETWGDKKPPNMKMPFRKGEEWDAENYPDYQGKIIVNARSYNGKPGWVGPDNVNMTMEQAKQELYSGCYMRATVTAFTYNRKGNVGVGFGLQNVQKVRDGVPFSVRGRATDDFEPIENTESSDVDNSDLFD